MSEVSKKVLERRRQRIIGLLCIAKPPLHWCSDDEVVEALQEWVCENLKPEVDYASGISVIVAAWNIAESQIKNGHETLIKE